MAKDLTEGASPFSTFDKKIYGDKKRATKGRPYRIIANRQFDTENRPLWSANNCELRIANF